MIFLLALLLRHAKTPEERALGLMHRTSFPEDTGMLFHYEEPQIIRLWAYNIHMDLDVAFLDEDFTILQISHLKAYPEQKDRNFFRKHAVQSNQKVPYALELPAGYLQQNNLKVGDQITP